MNLYSEIVRDTSINTVSTPKYHPLFFSPPHDKSGFSTSKGEKDISDTRISDSFRRPCGQVCLKPCFQERVIFSLLSSFFATKTTRVLVRLNLTHIGQLWYKNGIQVRIIVMSQKYIPVLDLVDRDPYYCFRQGQETPSNINSRSLLITIMTITGNSRISDFSINPRMQNIRYISRTSTNNRNTKRI